MDRVRLFKFAVVVAIVSVFGLGQAAERVNVLWLRGGGVHDWKNNPPILKEVLDATGDFAVTFTENLDDMKERVRQFDVLAVYTTGMSLTDEQEKGMCDFVQNGGGFVGIHSASDSFKNSDRYWEMVGGRFAGHGGGRYTVHIYDPEHPITQGLKDFEIQDETYRHDYHKNAQMRSLIRMNRGEERQSMGWVSRYGKGRVFFTGLGHGREAWSNPSFQEFVVRGMYWAAGREIKGGQVEESRSLGTQKREKGGFVSLFNGKDLTGWETKGNWVVEEGGVLAIKPRPGEEGWQRYDAYLWAGGQFADFILDLEFKIPEGGNSGVFVRVKDKENPVNTGIEVQINDTYGKEKVGAHDCGGVIGTVGPSRNMAKPAGQWNRMIVTCQGNQLQVELNGEQIVDVQLDKTSQRDRPPVGYIGLQDHGLPLWFRNIRMKMLGEAAESSKAER
jgi:type 1 glutamine amidotransferase